MSPTEEWGPAVEQFRTGIYSKHLVPPPDYNSYNDGSMVNPGFNGNTAEMPAKF